MFRVLGILILTSLIAEPTYATAESNLRFSVPRVLYDLDGPSGPTAAVTNVNATNFVDPVLTASEPAAEKPKSVPLTRVSGERISQLCASGELADHDCKVHWTPVLRESLEWLAIQHGGNWSMDHWMRWDTFKQPYWKGYTSALKNWRWTRWNDDDPFLDNYVGHPMMGAIISQIYIQNDPRSATLEFGKSKPYWKSRLVRSFWYSAAYSAQWKIGPASEASLEKVGSFVYYDAQFNKHTNGSGMVDFVATPVGGAVWLIAEDILDKYAMRKLENVSRNPLWLTAIAFVEPCRSAANVLRFRAPWYRDNRHVKAFEKRERFLASNPKP
jgi:hypothetical protein